ncbi:CarD family transcriptional regulator [Streptomyces sp. KL116D]|uniref:CarD family transcriptional regulator n=1 Tax=Streptomyces sp. KL116D TaxID=3045152 RepID=UPI003555EC41
MMWWSVSPVRRRRGPRRRHAAARHARARDVPRRHRQGPCRHPRAGSRTAGGPCSSPRATVPRDPHRRGARRRGHRGPPRQGPRRTRALRRPGISRQPRIRLRAPGVEGRRPHGDRPHRAEDGRQGRPADARQAPQDHRPAYLESGDYIVHEQHGVGRSSRWCSARSRRHPRVPVVEPRQRGQPGDRLYIPTGSAGADRQRIGVRRPDPAAIARRRRPGRRISGARAKKAVSGDRRRPDQAVLGAHGGARPTPAGPDTPWRRELEDAFPYAETPDQLTTIAEVKGGHGRRSRWTG